MKTIIAGSRTFDDYSLMKEVLAEVALPITLVISGNASGADQMGEWWAKENNIDTWLFPAKWDKYGKSAGYIRNIEMAKEADALIAFWDGISKGTENMIEIAKEKELIVLVHNYGESNGSY